MAGVTWSVDTTLNTGPMPRTCHSISTRLRCFRTEGTSTLNLSEMRDELMTGARPPVSALTYRRAGGAVV